MPVTCRDCREPLIEQKVSLRGDICDDCWNLRQQLVKAISTGSIAPETIRKTQRAMAAGRGTGAKRMREALGLSQK